MSLRQPINNMCKACIYDENSSGTWKQQVTDCTSKSCPLFNVRPTTKTIPTKQEQTQ
ncbi:hypothetical protein ACMXYR_05200 [Neptuniibacter sp. QD29_5]|uniref:hypothetical protein n=1 Tax=Neptuniibacter sp. QD29_5 TaxID=3398207 RepID=UPI0039F4B605